MKGFISTTLFGYINYVLALVMMSSPWLFGFAHFGGAAFFFPFMFGWFHLLMAIFSISKAGMVGIFPIQMHCTLETITGFVFVVIPWMYGFHAKVWLPHVIMGIVLLILGIYTKNSPLRNPAHQMLPEGQLGSTDSSDGRLSV